MHFASEKGIRYYQNRRLWLAENLEYENPELNKPQEYRIVRI